MPSPELKPCPRCGKQAMFRRGSRAWFSTPVYGVVCTGLRCELSSTSRFYDSRREAAAAWNRREGEDKP